MPKYRLYFRRTFRCTVDVEADDYHDACDHADALISTGELPPPEDMDAFWECTDAEPIS